MKYFFLTSSPILLQQVAPKYGDHHMFTDWCPQLEAYFRK